MTLPPLWLLTRLVALHVGSSLLVVLHVVGEAVHVARGGEDGMEVGEDVVVCEGDELASRPKHLPKEKVGVEVVPEGDEEADDAAGVPVDVVLQSVHPGRALREVLVAGVEKELRELPRAPPPRDGPNTKPVLDDDTGRVAPLRHGGRALVRRAVELHLR